MNMLIFKKNILLLCLMTTVIGFSSCKKDVDLEYKVTPIDVIDDDLIKTKQKSPKQFTSILFTNIYNLAISVDFLIATERVIESVGDKYLVNEIIISNYMNSNDKVIPSDSFMRAEPDSFIVETYLKFYLRHPNQMELSFFKSYIEANPNITPELIYSSFVSSDEYLYY
jgi:hypothetical protein